MAEENQVTQGGEKTAKVKKINKLPLNKIIEIIKDIEEKNLTQSRYYKQLLQRKIELGG
jgi:hypothetical protein